MPEAGSRGATITSRSSHLLTKPFGSYGRRQPFCA
jgi:hypothetical protein